MSLRTFLLAGLVSFNVINAAPLSPFPSFPTGVSFPGAAPSGTAPPHPTTGHVGPTGSAGLPFPTGGFLPTGSGGLPCPTGTGGFALPTGGFSDPSDFTKRSNFHPKRQAIVQRFPPSDGSGWGSGGFPFPTGTGGFTSPTGGSKGPSGFTKRANFHPKRQAAVQRSPPSDGSGSAQPSGGFGGFGSGFAQETGHHSHPYHSFHSAPTAMPRA